MTKGGGGVAKDTLCGKTADYKTSGQAEMLNCEETDL